MVRFLARKPNFLFLFSREFACMVFRGPQRTWDARKAGLAEMAVWGTRSGVAIVGVVACGVKSVGREKEGDRLGLRDGREEKVLGAR